MCYLQTPGPGAYGVIHPEVYKTKTPSYSMTARNNAVGDNTKKPGPGTHSPEKVSRYRNYNSVSAIIAAKMFLDSGFH